MNNSNAATTFMACCLMMSLVACQRQLPITPGVKATVPTAKGQSLRGSVDLLGRFVINLPTEFTITDLDLEHGQFYIGNSQLFAYVSVHTADTKSEVETWRHRAEEEVRQFKRNDVFSTNGLYYYGYYTERVEAVSDDHGFIGYVIKGNSQLYIIFYFRDDISLEAAKGIWKSAQ